MSDGMTGAGRLGELPAKGVIAPKNGPEGRLNEISATSTAIETKEGPLGKLFSSQPSGALSVLK